MPGYVMISSSGVRYTGYYEFYWTDYNNHTEGFLPTGTIYKDNDDPIWRVPSTGAVPVALDLDGDGIELISVTDADVSMDVDGDGTSEKIGWISPDDAWLALDKDGSGKIDHFNEISFINDTPGATSDLEGLQIYDTNNNGHLDIGDARYSEFLVWQDANSNGVSDAGELKTLAEADIVSIDLTPISTGDVAQSSADNVITGTSQYVKSDGTVGIVGDVSLGAIRVEGEASPEHSVTGWVTEVAEQPSAQVSTDHSVAVVVETPQQPPVSYEMQSQLEASRPDASNVIFAEFEQVFSPSIGLGGTGQNTISYAPHAPQSDVNKLVQAMAGFGHQSSAELDQKDQFGESTAMQIAAAYE